MKYAGYMPNDFLNGEDVCVSLWVSGCPHHCPHCHNSELWDHNAGYDVPEDLKEKLIAAIKDNNIVRNFSVLGGEPLCLENRNFVLDILKAVKREYSEIKIFIWTGYTYQELKEMKDDTIEKILSICDVLIDGKYVHEKRNIALPLRGSSNQMIWKRGINY